MKLKQLLEQLVKERPEALEMEVWHHQFTGDEIEKVKIEETSHKKEVVYLIGYNMKVSKENFKDNRIDYVLSHYPIFEIGCLLNWIVWGYIIGIIILG